MRGERVLDRAPDLVFERFLAARGEMRDLDRKTAARAGQPRRIEEAREPFAIERRRHQDDPQVRAQRRLHVQRERQAEVAGEVAFVEFVEQQRADAFEHRIVLQHAGEDALGDDLDPGPGRDLVLEADAVADGFAHRFAELPRHEAGGGARGHAPRFQHHDPAAGEPFRIQQCERYPGGLARARRRFQHQPRMRRERGADVRQQSGDGEIGVHCRRRRSSAQSRPKCIASVRRLRPMISSPTSTIIGFTGTRFTSHAPSGAATTPPSARPMMTGQ